LSFLRCPFAEAQGFGSGHRLKFLFCHSERSVSGVKNLILFRASLFCHSDPEHKRSGRISSGDPSALPQGDRGRDHSFGDPSQKLRASAQDSVYGDLPPRNDGMSERQPFFNQNSQKILL